MIFSLLGLDRYTNIGSSTDQVNAPASGKLITATDQSIVIQFSAPEYRLLPMEVAGAEFQQIEIPGTTQTNQPSHPRLPAQYILLGVPAGVDVTLETRIVDASFLSGKYILPPAEQPAPISQEYQPGVYQIEKRSSALAAPGAGIFPAEPAEILEDAWLRDQRIVRLAYYPFQYHPATGQLTWNKALQVTIKFDNAQAVGIEAGDEELNNPFELALQRSLLNYDQARAWRTLPGSRLTQQPAPYLSGEADNLAQPLYRISIQSDGLYRLTFENLNSAGFPVGQLTFANLKLTNQGRTVGYSYDDLDGNGQFGPGDCFIFYGQKFYGDWMAQRYVNENVNWRTFTIQLPNGSYSTWKPALNADQLEKYTDQNVYWLSVESSLTRPVSQSTKTTENSLERQLEQSTQVSKVFLPWISRNTSNASYPVVVHEEPSLRSRVILFAGEDSWFWDEIQTSSSATRTYSMNLTSPASGAHQVRFSGELVAAYTNDYAGPDHHIQIYLNDPLHTQPILDATWEGKSRFHFETLVDQNRLVNGSNQIDLVVNKTPSMSVEYLFLDWLQFEYQRLYIAENNRLTFTEVDPGGHTYRVSGFSGSDLSIFDITDPLQPGRILDFAYADGQVRFTADSSASARFHLGPAQAVLPAEIQAYTPVDFTTPADIILIADQVFLPALQSLADYRATQGFTTLLVDIQTLYNQFNDGIYNPIAIKNFLAYAFTQWSNPPSYVILVGDGHWNFKGSPHYGAAPIYMPPNLSWVDPWQGEVDSANLLATVVGTDPLPDVAISRIPVNSPAELSNVITKTIAYEAYPTQAWQKNLVFMADNYDPQAGNFKTSSETIINNHVPAGYTSDRFYLDDFLSAGLCVASGSRACPALTQATLAALNQTGAYLVNYAGHGSVNYWASEQLWINQDILSLSNSGKLPIVLSMTCLDGYWLHPSIGPSLAEDFIRTAQTGAVATFSPTGLGVASGHDRLWAGFYDSVFQGGATRLSQAALAGKLEIYTSGLNFDLLHTYTIFGDPALRLPIP
ncbi:MAG: C25 family cysteine peptidase [Anaerolineales bacterium]|nr:C25 family cysteine peptidase [Anaerolineales bacterium]